jgi:hypothetical protein
LLLISYDKDQKIKGQQGRVYRRFLRAFGLDGIAAASLESGGRVNPEAPRNTTLYLHEVTIENLEYLATLADKVDRTPVQEVILGPLFDLCADIQRDKTYESPADVAAFDPAKEDWTPPKKGDLGDDAVTKIAAYVRAAGFPDVADDIEKGTWDKK